MLIWGRTIIMAAGTALVAGCAAPAFKSQLIGAGEWEGEEKATYNRPQIIYGLPKTLVKIEAKNIQLKDGQGNPAGASRQVTISASNVPDQDRLYRIMYDSSAAHDDIHKLIVNEALLLNTASGQSRDRTGDIIVELAKLPAAIAKRTLVPDEKVQKPDKEFSVILDWKELEDIALEGGRPLPDGVNLTVVKGPFDVGGRTRTVRAPGSDCTTSFCYRTLVPVVLQLGDFQQTVLIADERNTWGIDLDRAALVQTKMDLSFRDGVLTGVDIDKPSTLLAAASLPLTILKAILTVPAEILRLRIDYDSEKEAAATQELATIKAQEELRKHKEGVGQADDLDKATPAAISPLG